VLEVFRFSDSLKGIAGNILDKVANLGGNFRIVLAPISQIVEKLSREKSLNGSTAKLVQGVQAHFLKLSALSLFNRLSKSFGVGRGSKQISRFRVASIFLVGLLSDRAATVVVALPQSTIRF
jgi:hypothetical protein